MQHRIYLRLAINTSLYFKSLNTGQIPFACAAVLTYR